MTSLGRPTVRDDRDWVATLDALSTATRTGVVVELPDDLGPLPRHLAARATAVLEEQRAAMAQLTDERERVASELAALRSSARPSRQLRAHGGSSAGFGATL